MITYVTSLMGYAVSFALGIVCALLALALVCAVWLLVHPTSYGYWSDTIYRYTGVRAEWGEYES